MLTGMVNADGILLTTAMIRNRYCPMNHTARPQLTISVNSIQMDTGKAELSQETRRARAAAARAKILMRGASPEKRRRASARDVFDSFDLDGSGTIDVSQNTSPRRKALFYHMPSKFGYGKRPFPLSLSLSISLSPVFRRCDM